MAAGEIDNAAHALPQNSGMNADPVRDRASGLAIRDATEADLPAITAIYEAHVLHGKQYHDIRGPVVLVLAALVVLITIAVFFLNAAFAFAISQPGTPDLHAGFQQARDRLPGDRGFSLERSDRTILGADADLLTDEWANGTPWGGTFRSWRAQADQ